MGEAIQVELLVSGVKDDSGEPLAGGKVYTYRAGTTTAEALWQNYAKTVNCANPIELDALGQAQVYAEGKYKLVIADSEDTIIRTIDNLVFGKPEISTWAGNTQGSGDVYTFSPAVALESYEDGQEFFLIPNHANTTTEPTLNVSALGAKDIVDIFGNAIRAGDIQYLSTIHLVYRDNRFYLLNPKLDLPGVSILKANLTTFTPSYSCSGSLDYTPVTQAWRYADLGDFIFVTGSVTGTTSGSDSTDITLGLPKSIDAYLGVTGITNGGYSVGLLKNAGGALTVSVAAGWGIGTTRVIHLHHFLPIA